MIWSRTPLTNSGINHRNLMAEHLGARFALETQPGEQLRLVLDT
jgi:hypothetical protein